jgi:hypothetical protein
MVKAGLPEPQAWVLKPEAEHRRFTFRLMMGATQTRLVALRGYGRLRALSRPNHITRPLFMGYGRTRHLTAPHLLHCVNTGSPLRAALNSPAWRRSSHSSQTPGVMPWTAAATRTAVAETDRATGRGTPASRVKGNASKGRWPSWRRTGSLMRTDAEETEPTQ